MTRDKTSFKCRRDGCAIHAGSDEDELLPTVAERRPPVRVDSGDRFASGRPVLLWGRRPPATEGPGVGQATGDAVLEDEVGVGLDPEPALGAALTWSLYLLSQAPDVRARVEAEVDAVAGGGPFEPEDVGRLVYTRAVIDEAVRLYPPVPFMSRAAIREDRIGSLKIPARSVVAIVPWVLHRHRKLWDEPDAFDPGPLPAGAPRRHRPLRLPALRRRPARLHRRLVLAAGGGRSCSRRSCATRGSTWRTVTRSRRCTASRCARRAACRCA